MPNAGLAEKAAFFVNNLTGLSCEFVLDTDKHPFSGGECVIYVLEADNRRIGVRMEKHISPVTRVKVQKEIDHLQAISKERIQHLPHLVGYDIASTPPILATSWANGNVLEWTDISPSSQVRKNVMRTVADVVLDMLKIQEEGGSALTWIRDKILRTRMRRSLEGTLSGVSPHDCETLLRSMSDLHLPKYDEQPHVLVHGDLSPNNIIVTEQQVECIVDFGSAAMVPLQFSAVYPRFLTNEPLLCGTKYDWSGIAFSRRQQEDRAFYLQCIMDLAPSKGEHARMYSDILAREDQQERHWCLSAVNRLDMMKALKTKPAFVDEAVHGEVAAQPRH